MANEPITREEILLNAVATGEAANLEPITREEMFLAKLGGADVTTPMPITRKEQFLQKAIEGGGPSGDGDELEAFLDRSITKVRSNALSVGERFFDGCVFLKSADFPAATIIRPYAFNACTALVSANFPAATSIGNSAFWNCSSLSYINFPVAMEVGTFAFSFAAFEFADFPMVTSIGGSAFYLCTKLSTLILRSETVATLSDNKSFAGTAIFNGTGYIYVPSALVDTYKAATNWSAYAAQFRALENYTVDGTTTGALDETKI